MKISDAEVFDIALNAETRTKEAYEKMASLTKSDIIRDELLFPAKEEDKHKQIIERMMKRFGSREENQRTIELKAMGEFKVIVEMMKFMK